MVSLTPLDTVDALFLDLDGVIYVGANAIPGAIESLNRVKLPLGYITNNASRSDETVAAHLRQLGLLHVTAGQVVTSPQAAIRLLQGVVKAGSLVFVVGGEGIIVELERNGYRITRSADDNPDAVVQGFSPEVGWSQLSEASFALVAKPGEVEIPWIATNIDWTIPVARGVAPGNGTLVSAVHSAVGRFPLVAGKPETPIFAEAKTRFAVSNPLMVGDRLDTDILGANRAGLKSALVLTGVDRAKQVLAAPEKSRPYYIFTELSELHQPYPQVQLNGSVVKVGTAKVVIDGRDVRIVDRGSDAGNLLRAACAAIWAAPLAIHSLNVPEELYVEGLYA